MQKQALGSVSALAGTNPKPKTLIFKKVPHRFRAFWGPKVSGPWLRVSDMGFKVLFASGMLGRGLKFRASHLKGLEGHKF